MDSTGTSPNGTHPVPPTDGVEDSSSDPLTIRPSTPEEATSELGDVDLKLLQDTLDYIRPAVQMDGGDLILTGVDDGVVQIQMVGACGGCPLSQMTLTQGIERILKDRVPGVVGVNAQ